MHRIIDKKRFMGRGLGDHRAPGTPRKLALQTETLRVLTTPELHRIVGGELDDGITSIRPTDV